MSDQATGAPGNSTVLDFDEYADGIADASVVLRDNAARSGLDRAVPSCPGWTMDDLVRHVGVVHRWARAAVLGERLDVAGAEREAAGEADVLTWLDDGVHDLLRTLDRAPEDLDAWFFLADPPPARLGWARRQCHETTMHAVDAMTASLGHAPTARQVWFGPRLAADGIDELLGGFLPRRHTTFRPAQTGSLAVRPSDADAAWTVRFSPEGITTTREATDADSRLSGPAVDLYLALWNRSGPGQDVVAEGAPLLEEWRAGQHVRWG